MASVLSTHRVREACALLLTLLLAGCEQAPAALVLNHDRLAFGEVEVGGTYRLRLALSNPGDQPLAVKSVRLDPASEALSLEGLPLETLGAGERHVVTVVLAPTGEGALSAVLHVEAADGAHALPVDALAVRLGAVVHAAPGASCPGAEGSIDFGTTVSGTPGTRTLTVESTGTGTISILNAALSPGDAGFTLEGLGDGLFLAPGQVSTLTVRYDPTRAGPQAGVISLQTSSLVAPRLEVPICGTGMVAALCTTPASLSFGAVAPGAASAARFTVSSCGNLPVTMTTASVVPEVATAPGFTLDPAPGLPLELAPGQQAFVDVRFAATSALTARGRVRLGSTSPVTPEVFVALGANLPPPCNATLGPASLRFYKDLASAQSVRLVNHGGTACRIDRLDFVPAGTGFAIDRQPTLPAVLAAHASMDLLLTYAPPPTATSLTTARLQVELDWVHEVLLTGDPRPPPGCHLVPALPAVYFGLVGGGGLLSRSLDLINVGAGPCVLHGVTVDHPGYTVELASMLIDSRDRIAVTLTWWKGQFEYGPPAPATMTISSSDRDQPQLEVPITSGQSRCDPNCDCAATQTATYWRFADHSVGSGVTPADGGLGAFQESCEPGRCTGTDVSVEIDRGVLVCEPKPPTCTDGNGLEFQNEGWSCVPCELIVQFGGLFAGQRACAPAPTLSCQAGLAPTFDAVLRTWDCVRTCNNGQYDQRVLADGTLVCVPC